MSDLFLKVVNVSISASWLVLAVIALRFLLKKVPKWITVLLWGIVAVRLLLPFSIESVLSMVPSSETISPHIAVDAPSTIYTSTPIINTGIPIINNAINPIVIQGNTPAPGDSVNPLQVKLAIAANIWLLGVVVMALLAGISYWRLRRKVVSAVRLRDRIYRSEFVDSPFVLGIFRPKIYLPYVLEEAALSHVIAHELTHIRRKDHWWKPLGFLLLSIHWMNPMMWVGYILLCRDIELACDEKVVKKLEPAQKADYSQALLSCSVNRKMIAICPLAFGEVGVKQRVKNVLNYKKPAFWVVLTGIIVCIVVAVCFLTDPKEEKALATGVEYYPDFFYFQNSLVNVDYDTLLDSVFLVNEDRELMVIENPKSGKWATIGKLKEIELSTISLLKLFSTKIKHFNSVSKTWRSEVNPGQQGLAYYLFEMKDGRQYLACGESKHDSPKHAIHWIVGLKEEMPQKQSQNTAESSENSIQEVTLPEYPGITFFSDGENTVAIDEDHNPVIIDAEPLSFVLFADLTGDGNEELCVSYSFGSGIVRQCILAYDHVADRKYSYEESNHSAFFDIKVENDSLNYYKRNIFDRKLLESGLVVISPHTYSNELRLLKSDIGHFSDETTEIYYDVLYKKRIEDAMSNYEICQINAEFIEKYKVMIDDYFESIIELSSDSLKQSLIDNQAAWENITKSNLDIKQEELYQIYESGSIVPMLYSSYEYELYRERAIELSEMYTMLKHYHDDLYPILLVDAHHGIDKAYIMCTYQKFNMYLPDEYLYNGKPLSFYLFQQETEVTSDILDVAKPFTFMAPDGNRTTATVNGLRCVPQAIDETVRVKAGLTYSSQPNSQWLLGTYSTVDIFPEDLIRKDQFLSADLDGDSSPEQVSWSFTPADPGLYGDGYYYYSITVEQNGTAYTIPGTEYLPTTKDDLAVFPADLNQDGYCELIIAERRMSRFGYVSIYQFSDGEYKLIMNYNLNGEP